MVVQTKWWRTEYTDRRINIPFDFVGFSKMAKRNLWFRFTMAQEKESRLPSKCSSLGSFLVAFLKDPSEPFMAKENSTIGQIVNTK